MNDRDHTEKEENFVWVQLLLEQSVGHRPSREPNADTNMGEGRIMVDQGFQNRVVNLIKKF